MLGAELLNLEQTNSASQGLLPSPNVELGCADIII